MKWWRWGSKQMSPHEREITESIKSLKTLTVRDGRVSIDPSEVLLQPGYLEDRKRAAQLVKHRNPSALEIRREWGSLSDSKWTNWHDLSPSG